MPFATIASAMRRLYRNRRGNVLAIVGFSIIPLTFATGMAVDYTRAARLQTKLNAIADAAALSAVTTPMMSQTSAQACVTAGKMFTTQAAPLSGLSMNMLDPNQLTIAVTDSASSATCSTTGSSATNNYSRVATVTWKAQSLNSFSGILGMAALGINGKSEARATVAPNIDFYLLLDTSGSMAFPSTSDGITTLRAKTGGCAFACHSTNDATAKDASGKYTDYYGVATSFGIPLRVDEARKAVQDMMTQATNIATNNKAKYRAALATFAAASTQSNNYYKVQQSVTANLTLVSNASKGIQTSLYYRNSCPTSTYCNNDTDTATSDAFTRINALMPNPGAGSNASGDTPQSILFIITDGMRDENRPSGRPEAAIDTSLCDTIKNRNIRIAILYTEYLKSSMDGDGWSQSNVVPYLYKIEPALQSCASSGLYYKVSTDDDISTALNRLFQQAVATAHITQ